MSFASPWLLLSLLVVPAALAGYLLLQRRRNRYVVRFTNLDVLAGVVERRRQWRRHVPAALLLAALTVLCVALAKPTVTLAAPKERSTVVLVVDVSGSMRAQDVRPTRLAAAQAAIEQFLEEVPDGLQVALVSFSDDAEVVTVPTDDRELLREGLAQLAPGFGTAIGDAVARAVGVVEAEQAGDGAGAAPPAGTDGEEAPTSSILMLSDGFQTRGILTPDQGASRAKKLGVPVYTIALGTDEGVVEIVRDGVRQTIPVPPDRQTLARIAESTGGEYFDALDAEKLRDVYAKLGATVGRVDTERQVTVGFVAAGAALLAAAGVLAGLWLPRLP